MRCNPARPDGRRFSRAARAGSRHAGRIQSRVDHEPKFHIDNRAKDGHSTGDKKMTTFNTGTREEWLAARLELLAAEKELTRRSDELAQQGQALPRVRYDEYQNG
jgi:hypothetical protein